EAGRRDGGESVRQWIMERLEQRHVLAEHAEIGDGGVRGDGYGRREVEQLDPADQEADRFVERAPREARAAARVWEGGRAFRVVERGGDEDESGEDERQRGEAERKRRGHAQRVVDARADIAVAGGEQRRRAQRARELGRTPDHDAEVAWPPAPSGDRIRAHRTRE